MLHDHRPGRCGDEHRGGGNIEEVQLVATGATDVEGRAFEFQQPDMRVYRLLEEGLDEAGDFRGRLALQREGFKQAFLLGIRRGGIQQQGSSHRDFAGRQVLLVFQMLNQGVHGRRLDHQAGKGENERSREFRG